jgi:hypothetical protein
MALTFAGLAQEQRIALACQLDPAIFSQRAGVTPHDWQARLLRSEADRILINCSRQSGKSTTMATIGLHEGLYVDESLTLIVSPTQRQSGELFKKLLALYRRIGKPVVSTSESALQLELENGSRIVALPGKDGTVRGYSAVSLLILDEAAKIKDDLYRTVRPMLAVSHGRLIAASTPFGTRGWWYDAYVSNQKYGGWDYYEINAEQAPLITPEFLEEERRELGAFWFAQEYMCKFLDSQGAAFRAVDIEAALALGL